MRTKTIKQKIAGLIPAAGAASRLAPLSCSKEIYPFGFQKPHKNGDTRIKVAGEYLIESMRMAMAVKVYIVLRKGKWDIPQYFGSGKWIDMDFAYLIMDLPFGVPFTIDQAYNFVKDDIVVFGFPDIVFKPNNAFLLLLAKQAANGADVVLGLFHAPQPFVMQHMVKIDPEGKVRGFQIEPPQTTLRYTWIIAVWNQKFTRFLHEFVLNEAKNFSKGVNIKNGSKVEEINMTQAFQAALHKGVLIDSVIFEEGQFLDIGSYDNLRKAAQVISEF